MRSVAPIAALCLVLAGCGSRDGEPEAAANAAGQAPPDAAAPANNATAAAPRWVAKSTRHDRGLAFVAEGRERILLMCAGGQDRLTVVVPFRPVGSEERLSLGSGGEVAALVAGPSADAQFVVARGAVPDNFAAMLAGPLSASYGAQRSGPHPAPPAELARALVTACGGPSAAPAAPGNPPAIAAGPCMMQGSERLQVRPLRAIGTEPFWAARIEGRCVTYSHPEDQAGTRIWTRFTPGPGGGTWTGALGGRRFELRTRPQPDCSDGMSDKSYPIAVALTVDGEQRSGCAEPS